MIYSDCPEGALSEDQLTHAVLVIGYDDSGGFWRVMNSYGAGWGWAGEININYSRDCGIRQKVSFIEITNYYDNPVVTIPAS